MLQYIVIVGAIIQIIGITLYCRGVIYGNTRPNKMTRLMRSLAPLIGSAAAFIDGARWSVVPVFMSGLGPLAVCILSLFVRHAYWQIEKLDYLCGILSLWALVGWRATQEPLVAIILAIMSDICAAIPTIIKSWKYPGTESPYAYFTGLLSYIMALFAIQTYNLTEIAFPFYLIILNTSMVIILSRRELLHRRRKFKIQHL